MILPDEWPIQITDIPVATYDVVKGHAVTVGDVRRMTDAELLAIHRLGAKRLAQLRAMTTEPVTPEWLSDAARWHEEVRHLVLAAPI